MNTDGFSKKVMEFEIQVLMCTDPFQGFERVLAILFSFFVLKKSLKIVFY